MLPVLIDTSVFLDLVFFHQARHRRNRAVASSAAAALEALLLYESPRVEAESYGGLLRGGSYSRFLRFYCDGEVDSALAQLRDLRGVCGSPDLSAAVSGQARAAIEGCLAVVEDPDDLRAYELYDYLPYHLGEDPTAVECALETTSVADIELIDVAHQATRAEMLGFAEILRARRHPTRAAWALPLFRLFHYQAVQAVAGTHFVPHATKATIAFGRECETVGQRRLLDYCTAEFRAAYLGRAEAALGGLLMALPVPPFAEALLRRSSGWIELLARIREVAERAVWRDYALELRAFIEQLERLEHFQDARPELESSYDRLRRGADRVARELSLRGPVRRLRIALPLVAPCAAGEDGVAPPRRLMLIHDLFSAAQTPRDRKR